MKLDDVKKLHQKKYRTELRHFLVEGEHLVLELQKAADADIASGTDSALAKSQLFVTESYADWVTSFPKTLVSTKQMAQLSDTKTPQGILAVVPFLPPLSPHATERAIYLHEVQDPGNLGTILRTLAWFGGFRCLLSPGCVDPYNPKVVRSSMGAIFHVPVELDVTLDQVRQRFPRIACLDMAGQAVRDASFQAFDCYLFGNEARGVPRDQLAALSAQPFTIAGGSAIESLNLASAVNICIYELKR